MGSPPHDSSVPQESTAYGLVLMQATLDAATDGILTVSRQGEIRNSNAALRRIWGIPSAFPERMKVHDFQASAAGQTLDSAAFLSCIAEIEASDTESADFLRMSDGRLIEQRSTVLKVEGAEAGRVWIFRDVTHRYLNEIDSRRLAAIVTGSDDGIISKDLNGIITSWNESAERVFGYTREEALNRPVTMLIPADRQDEERLILERLRRGERIDLLKQSA